ncbi:MAG: hypothetical protein ACLUAR_12890 [Pilosibacter sp.]
MQRIAKFEKVSFEQFKKDWQGEHPQDTEEVIREIYDGSDFRSVPQQALPDMISSHRQRSR